MAETSALLFSHLTISRVWDAASSSPPRFSLLSRARPSRSARFSVKSSHYGSFSDDDAFSFFPWSDGNNGNFNRLSPIRVDGLIIVLVCFLWSDFSTFTNSKCVIWLRRCFCWSFCWFKRIAFYLTAIEWVPEERVTLFTSDGLVQIGGNMVPRRIKSSHVCVSFPLLFVPLGLWLTFSCVCLFCIVFLRNFKMLKLLVSSVWECHCDVTLSLVK